MPHAEPEERAAAPTLLPPWSAPRRVAFRFLFAYVLLYILPLGMLLRAPVVWVGTHVLRLDSPITIFPNGSGDTRYNYVELLVVLVLAAVAAAVWSVRDHRTEYRTLFGWTHVLVRYYLGMVMIGYGIAKIVPTQFPSPDLERLTQPLGELLAMGLLWTFMGHTYAFNRFTGLGEAVGGLLLFFRRTALAGTLLLLAVIANVVVLNYAFDVPVKLFATHLLLLNVLLVAPHTRRLVDALVLNRGVGPGWLGPEPSPAWARARRSLKPLLLVGIAGVPFAISLYRWSTRRDPAQATPLYGIYDVERFVRNGDTVPVTDTARLRWHRVVFPNERSMVMRTLSGSRRHYATWADTAERRLIVSNAGNLYGLDPNFAYVLTDSSLQLDGVFDGDTLSVRLRRVDHTKFLLTSRGYHWVNEYPFNR